MRRWYALALGAAVLALMSAGAAAGTLHPRTAEAAQTYTVIVGTDIPDTPMSLQGFYPSVITVVAGDTINWNFAGFHTVTFTAGGPPPDLVLPPRANGDVPIGPAFLPIPPGPMPPTGPYDGKTPVSTGVPQGDPAEEPPFSLTFTSAGQFHYICAIHPGMEADVVVLPAGSTAPWSPAEASAAGQREIAVDTAELRSFIAAANSASATSGTVTAKTVNVGIAFAGAGSALAMLPAATTVKRGDIVTFVDADPYEVHTVTFLSGQPGPLFTEIVPNPMGPPDIFIPARAAAPVGGTVYTGTGYLNSGILIEGQAFAVTFDAPPGTYEYVCLVHDFVMKGTITVQ